MIKQDATDPTGVSTEGSNRTPAVRARDRKAAAAIELRLANADWDQIAEVLGYPTARHALVATERALEKQLSEESKAKLRQMAGRRLERLIGAVWSKAIDPNHPDQLQAVGKAREIIMDHSKLMGLNAPAEVVVHSPSATELEHWVAQVTSATLPQLEEADIIDIEFTEDEEEAM